MTNVEFKKAVREFQSKFKELENSVIIIENNGDVHASMQGNIIGTISALIDAAHNDEIQFSILLTVGEVLRQHLSPEAISSLTKVNLKKQLEKNVN
jgi:hypothetical protein